MKLTMLTTKRRRITPPASLADYAGKRNRVLIVRETGGLGDILMHRMLFHDFKRVMPDIHLGFACPAGYHSALRDHPLLDELLDCRKVNVGDFAVSYNTTMECVKYEMAHAPLSGLHRSDIWAKHCGVELTRHDMDFRLSPEAVEHGRLHIARARDQAAPHQQGGKAVLVSPITGSLNKDLTPEQIGPVISHLRQQGLFVFAMHTTTIPGLDCPQIAAVPLDQWLGVVNAADYVVSADTGVFHAAGGMRKPLVGVFSWADGKVYGRHFDFVLVQKHRDDGWECGPCYNWYKCPKCPGASPTRKPCITETTSADIIAGVDRMLKQYPV